MEGYTLFYDKSHKDYKKATEKTKTWEAIAGLMMEYSKSPEAEVEKPWVFDGMRYEIRAAFSS